MLKEILFRDWWSLLRVVVLSIGAYAALVLFLRLSGKRTLSKLSAFDLIVTVALGSSLSTVILSQDTPLANGLLAFAMLILLQFLASWASVRSRRVEQALNPQPCMLFYRGAFLDGAMKAERVTRDEVTAAVRQRASSLEQVEAVVLETDGSLTVLKKTDQRASALRTVPNAPGEL